MEVKVLNMELEVTTTRVIRCGSTHRISPSYGCLDIKAGIVKVIAIGSREAMKDNSYDYESWEVDNVIPPYWVKYEYQSTGETEILPFEEFADHLSRA